MPARPRRTAERGAATVGHRCLKTHDHAVAAGHDPRDYVVEHLYDEQAVPVVDETGDVNG